MYVIVTDLLVGECELTGKSGIEVVRVRLDNSTASVNVSPAELLKLLRLKKKQEVPDPRESQE